MDNNSEEERRGKLRRLVAAMAGVVVLVILVVVSIVSNNTPTPENERDYDMGLQDDGTPTVVFENRYQLDYSIGRQAGATIFLGLENVVLGAEEISSAPQSNSNGGGQFTGTLMESSFKKADMPGARGFVFNLEMSDGRKYQVFVRTDEAYSEYYASMAQRTDATTGRAYLTIDVLNTTLDETARAGLIEDMTNWARELAPGAEIVLNAN